MLSQGSGKGASLVGRSAGIRRTGQKRLRDRALHTKRRKQPYGKHGESCWRNDPCQGQKERHEAESKRGHRNPFKPGNIKLSFSDGRARGAESLGETVTDGIAKSRRIGRRGFCAPPADREVPS